jgi:endonuclease/exonuclease/phosphatase family metal-dependent hydrolase
MNRLIPILIIISISLHSQSLKVMTYNLRLDTEQDGVNQWGKRKDKVFALILKNKPAVLGVQEALANQIDDLKNNLPDYDYVGVGRDDGKRMGEFSAIFYRKDKFNAVASGTYWLSETPEMPGSKSWDAAITRVATWAKLVNIKSKDTIFVTNTHFDHIGKVARENSASLIKTRINKLAGKLPVILTGDFNIEPTEPPYSIITNGDAFNLQDSGKGNHQGTYCTFAVGTNCKRIDYIFYSVGWKVKKYSVLNQNDGKYYPSDHLPVIATLYR